MDKRTPLQRSDIFIWIGEDAMHVWDRRRDEESEIPFVLLKSQKIPYVPQFHILWEDPAYYQSELRDALGRGKHRVLLAIPEDVTAVERIALEDFIYAALERRLKRNGLLVCSHSVVLGEDRYIAVTRTCRCYCVALVEDGEVSESRLLDAHKSERSTLDWEVRDYRRASGDHELPVYYPETEEDWTLMGLGKSVSFSRMATMDQSD